MSGGDALRLFCFHHAGAGVSSFARWQQVLGGVAEVVPVLLPGRDARSREQRITDPELLLKELDERIGPLMDRPYALYGHSLGGMVAYTCARGRQEAGGRPPELVVVGATNPPHLRSPLLRGVRLPDPELLEVLVAYGVLPRDALVEESVWQRRVLPALRDDLRLAEALCEVGGPPLESSLLAVAGTRDPLSPASAMAEWDRYAGGGFGTRTVPGDHFFVRNRVTPELLRGVLGTAGVPVGA